MIENENMQIMPEHLVYALVDQDGGLIGSLLEKCGVDTDRFLAAVDNAISNLPKVSGSGREPDKVYISKETEKKIIAAEALKLIKSGDVLFLDSGTTVCLFSMALAEVLREKRLHGIKIFTNSYMIINIII